MGRKFLIGIAALVLVSLAIGIYWTSRLDIPRPTPWWYGKDVVVRAEVWEPGKDLATFAMTMPKKTLDAMYALRMESAIDLDGQRLELRDVWGKIQRLPKGERLRLVKEDATVVLWIEERGAARSDTSVGADRDPAAAAPESP